MSIVLDVNYIPNALVNWPSGITGYICGTIPSNDASCYSETSTPRGRNNIDSRHPRTFESCCNGPITNVTSEVTNTSDPSYGATCLQYCSVDFVRTIEPDSFGDYWNCLSNSTDGSFGFDDSIQGQVTCGWVNVSAHDECEISLAVESSYSATATSFASVEPWDNRTTATATTTRPASSCPAQQTANSITSAATATTTKSSSGLRMKTEFRTSTLFILLALPVWIGII
jgi:hypothetical protein